MNREENEIIEIILKDKLWTLINFDGYKDAKHLRDEVKLAVILTKLERE
jgi:hypothetical protein